MTIGERIRTRRKELNLTMKAIFDQENIKTGNLSELENDKYLPSVQTLIALSRVLECSIDWILTGKEYVPPDPEVLNIENLKTEQGLLCDGSPLNNVEADLVAMYRLLPSYVQEDTFDQVFCLYRKYVERKRESIYWTYGEDEKGGPAEGREAQGGTA